MAESRRWSVQRCDFVSFMANATFLAIITAMLYFPICAYADATEGKIYNEFSVWAFSIGVFLLVSRILAGEISVYALVARCVLCMFWIACALLRLGGAGDFKMLMASTMLLGWRPTVIGLVASLIPMTIDSRQMSVRSYSEILRDMRSAMRSGRINVGSNVRLPYAVYFGLGMCAGMATMI